MKEELFHVHINKMNLGSFDSFFKINGRFCNNEKDSYFLRYIGFNNKENYLHKINEYDSYMNDRIHTKNCGYYRINQFDTFISSENISFYNTTYEHYQTSHTIECKFQSDYKLFQDSLFWNVSKLFDLYKKSSDAVSESMQKNFAIKLFYWIDTYFPHVFLHGFDLALSPKFVFFGSIKMQEYLFLYLLSCMGCDVLYLNPYEDLSFSSKLLSLSQIYSAQNKGTFSLPAYELSPYTKTEAKTKPLPSAASSAPVKINIKRPDSQKKIKKDSSLPNEPLPYTSLAQIASSVVMIGAFDNNHECFKSGSGVMIGTEGYILTNFHVANEACYYSVKIEEDETTYETSELIKYNAMFDLAIIRIQRRCTPIPLCSGNPPLVRGQKVAAIGSPLGLFNSVSDGIISGFRQIGDTSMIQFTAPISHGSSGGALLNLYGELIGLITAHFDDGQNLNLAVNCNILQPFVRGFI